ncbi:MAG: metallophosphoesterase, partial [bacterium]
NVFGYNPMEVLSKKPSPVGKWKFGVTADLHVSKYIQGEILEKYSPDYVPKTNIFQSTLLERNIQLLLNAGDVINWYGAGTNIEDWAKYEELWGTSNSQIAHFIAPGNHEVYCDVSNEKDFDKYIKATGFPGQTKEKMDYFFDFGKVRFICINSNDFFYRNGKYATGINDDRKIELQNYLDGLFNSAIGKIDHIIIFQHMDAYSPCYRYDSNNSAKLQIIYDYLANKYPNKKYFTITLLHGHAHMYYRTLRHGMYFIEVPSGGANGTWTYSSQFLSLYNNPEYKHYLDLIENDVWGKGEQCFIEAEVDGKTIEFKLVAFNDCVPYFKGDILSSIKLTVEGDTSLNNNKDSMNFINKNYPNPFNPECYIPIEIPNNKSQNLNVKIKIYNILGQVVREVITNNASNSIYWDGRDNLGKEVSSGMYFYETIINNKTQNCKKMLMLK